MSWAKWLLILVVCVSVVGCSGSADKKALSVRNVQELEAMLKAAEEESQPVLEKAQIGEPLDQLDRDALIRSGDKFKAMINFDPSNWRLYLGSLKVDLALEDFESAKATVTSVEPHIPQQVTDQADTLTLAELYGDIARLHILLNDYTKADLANKVARKLVPTNVDYMATEASILIQEKQYAAASKVLAKGIELVPNHRRLLTLNKLLLLEQADAKEKP